MLLTLGGGHQEREQRPRPPVSPGLQGPLCGLVPAGTQLAKETGQAIPHPLPPRAESGGEAESRALVTDLGCLTCGIPHHFLLKQVLERPGPWPLPSKLRPSCHGPCWLP